MLEVAGELRRAPAKFENPDICDQQQQNKGNMSAFMSQFHVNFQADLYLYIKMMWAKAFRLLMLQINYTCVTAQQTWIKNQETRTALNGSPFFWTLLNGRSIIPKR